MKSKTTVDVICYGLIGLVLFFVKLVLILCCFPVFIFISMLGVGLNGALSGKKQK